jgi:glutamate racemase
MKIGIFDSGLGGLIILQAIRKLLPTYDYIYLGDTKRAPYGNRSPRSVYQWTTEAVEYLFRKDCQLVIIACNTASVEALRKIQHTLLPSRFPARRVLGVVVPTIENALARGGRTIGLIGTKGTVSSGVYAKELRKKNARAKVYAITAPLLASLIENGDMDRARAVLAQRLARLARHNVDSVILGCTHYALIKKTAHTAAGPKTKIISQDEVIPQKLRAYFKKHPEISTKLSHRGTISLRVTKKTKMISELGKKWFPGAKLKTVTLHS